MKFEITVPGCLVVALFLVALVTLLEVGILATVLHG